jgi:anti-anti-sigma factor
MNANWTFDHRSDGTIGMEVVGDVDMAAEEPIVSAVAALFAGGTDRIEVDLTNVEFMDSAGLRTLMRLRHEFADRIHVAAVSPAVRRLFAVAGVTEWLMPGEPIGSEPAHPAHPAARESGAA